MDSITQAALGIAIAHVGFKNSVSNTKLILFGAIVATLPDLDIYFAKFFNDPLAEIQFHRGISHSIIFFVFLTYLIVLLSKSIFKNVGFKKMYLTTFFILLTHSLLDVFTTWGTQLFWWYPAKYALKSIFVVDIFYTIPLILGIVLGFKRNIKFTYLGLLISTLYLFWGLIAQTMVKSDVKHIFAKNIGKEIQNITVKPTFSNSILWNVIIETQDGFYLSDRKVFEDKPMKFNYYPHNHQFISEISNNKDIKRLIDISENQFIITQNSNGLVFNDLRFGLLNKSETDVQFAFSYQIIQDTENIKVVEMPKNKRDGKKLLIDIWNRIFE